MENILFIKTLEDLETKSKSNDWYDMLLMAGLVYKLLYDQHPLLQAVSNSQVLFDISVSNPPAMPGLVFWSVEDGIDPETCVPGLKRVESVDKSGLYTQVILVSNGENFSVKDLIRFLRNKQGGVHVDNVTLEDREKILKEIQNTIAIGGAAAGLRLMRAISRVVVRGLTPVKNEVIDTLSN